MDVFVKRNPESTEYTGSPRKRRTGAFYLWVGMLIPALIMLIGFIVWAMISGRPVPIIWQARLIC